jgi:hypothetical protein
MAYYVGDAVSELIKIKGTAEGLDYSTLPSFAHVIRKKDKLEDGKKVGEEDEHSRDMSAMISMLTVAIQQLDTRLAKLEK